MQHILNAIRPKPDRRRIVPIVLMGMLFAFLVSMTLTACDAGAEPEVADGPGRKPSVVAPSDGYVVTEESENSYAAGSYAYAYEDVELEPADPFNTEEYAYVDERGFTTVHLRPLSTVSADVDTASFANLRRMLEDGWSLDEIPTGAVRIEEILNYLDYDYPDPRRGELFSMNATLGPCPWNPDTELLVLGFSTAREDTARSAGSNLVFLIDVSGSMDSPDKLDLLKESFEVLVGELDGNDRVSIVTYASG
ncbi:MAG: von Willebrand factor type A domain-containing protein, partial [Atopobiaceae bacterium]|nr:von Willebrand factor type A domain-containing protein [Atopobiaceae bacterium]